MWDQIFPSLNVNAINIHLSSSFFPFLSTWWSTWCIVVCEKALFFLVARMWYKHGYLFDLTHTHILQKLSMYLLVSFLQNQLNETHQIDRIWKLLSSTKRFELNLRISFNPFFFIAWLAYFELDQNNIRYQDWTYII